jgi:hypothetical protein
MPSSRRSFSDGGFTRSIDYQRLAWWVAKMQLKSVFLPSLTGLVLQNNLSNSGVGGDNSLNARRE